MPDMGAETRGNLRGTSNAWVNAVGNDMTGAECRGEQFPRVDEGSTTQWWGGGEQVCGRNSSK
jgi:hypothetical protein